MANALRVEPAQITDDLEFNSIPEWDSLNHVALILSLEEAYGLTIGDDQIVELTRFSAIHQFVAAQVSELTT